MLEESSGGYILVKTLLGLERVAATHIADLDPDARIEPLPRGLGGLVLVHTPHDRYVLGERIEAQVPEAEHVVVADAWCRASLDDILQQGLALARSRISASDTFAIRTTRRGKHDFTSIDVNVRLGDLVRRETGASVDLTLPDKVLAVEILHDLALLAVYPGSKERRKMRPGKAPLYPLFRHLTVVQMPYLGPLDACRAFGVRIGREIQTFEVGELVIAPIGCVKAEQLRVFLDGVFEGVESRYEIQRRTYGRRVHRTRVFVQDLYQLVRDRYRKDVILVFEPEGEPVSKLAHQLDQLVLQSGKRVNLLFGAREGIPAGIFRFADLVIDLSPGITIATDYAACAGLIALATLLHERLLQQSTDRR